VCITAFKHCSGLSNGFIYSHNKRLQGSDPTPEDRKIDSSRLAEIRVRNAPVKETAVMWLQELSELATILPNCPKGFKILPYRTPNAVHAIFVREMEIKQNCYWIEDQNANYDAVRGVKNFDTGVLGDLVVVPPDGVADRQVLDNGGASVMYRYGNPLLGQKGLFPEGQGIANFSYFIKCWHDDPIAGLSRCRAFMPFAKCDTCVLFRAKDLESCDLAEKAKLRKDQVIHLTDIKRERSCYYQNRLRGANQQDQYLSMIIDGANQANHAVPHSVEKSHVSDTAWKMQLHLMGVIVHGRGTWAFTCPPHVAQGNNMTIAAIWEVICDIFKKDGKLPPVLLLQLDNTSKQCKGKYLFGFLGLLVSWGLFDKVIVGFLAVGHTHEDIDQFFSRISLFMRNHPAMTREEFGECIRNSYTKNGSAPIVRHWDSVANISEWIKPSLGDMKGIKEFRHFKIVRMNSNDGVPEVRMMVRNSPGSLDPMDKWRGPQPLCAHVEIFPKGVPDLLADADADRVPACQRSAACKDAKAFALMLENVNKGLLSLFNHLPRFTQAHFDSCKSLVDLVSTPIDVPIPFAWSRADIRALMNARSVEDFEVEHPSAAAEVSTTYHNTNDFLLLRPADGDTKPFYIAQIVKKVFLAGNRPGVHLRNYVHDEGYIEDLSPITGCYEPSLLHHKMPWHKLPLFPINGSHIQCKISMVKAVGCLVGGAYRMKIHTNSLKEVRYWISIFESGDLYDVEADEQPPAAEEQH
jgi:hypothetical protein